MDRDHLQRQRTHFDYSRYLTEGVMTKTDPNGQALEYTYDEMNNLIQLKLNNAAGIPTYTYRYDDTEQLDQATFPGGVQKFSYDLVDRVKSIDDFGSTKLLEFEYDPQDRITWVVYPDKTKVCYEYTLDGQLKFVGRTTAAQAVTSPCNSAAVKTDYTYDAVGRLDKVSYPNGIEKYVRYSASTGQVEKTGYRYTQSNALIYEDRFEYIPNTRLYDKITRTTPNSSAVTDYDYDAYERLTTVIEADGRRTQYEYDNFGNRTKETIDNINDANATGGTPKAYGIYTYVYPSGSNRLKNILYQTNAAAAPTTLEELLYDNAGRITKRTKENTMTIYTFDDRGFLTQVNINDGSQITTVNYTYDALGVRRSKTVMIDGTVTNTRHYVTANLFGFSRVLMELNNSDYAVGNIKKSTIYAGHQPLIEEPATGSRSFFLANGTVGSITHQTDSSGTVTAQYDYDAFGQALGIYTGEEYDAETDLLYLRARYYDPSIGRFISADPYWERLDEPVTQNRFIYVQNNPLLFTDPNMGIVLGALELL